MATHFVKKAVWLLVSIVAGALTGLGLTAVAVDRPPNFGVIESGPWIARPGIGSTSADPYSRALMAARGEIPMGAAEGIVLVAERDSTGRPLRPTCTYRLEGAMPAAEFWTLTAYRHGGVLLSADTRSAYTSVEAMIRSDGGVTIALSRDPQAGNWIPLRGTDAFELHLRLYETQVSSVGQALERVKMPTIRREACQ